MMVTISTMPSSARRAADEVTAMMVDCGRTVGPEGVTVGPGAVLPSGVIIELMSTAEILATIM